MQAVKQSIQQRKEDVRKKIMLGGLFVKAELDHFYPHDPAILYGMLLECKERLHNNPDLANSWKQKGKELLTSKHEGQESLH